MNINPVKATCLAHDCENGRDIQTLNDTCFGICSAFGNAGLVGKNCQDKCVDFIEGQKHRIFGVGSCDHQTPYRPVYWEDIPRYVPSLLSKGYNLNEAKQKCLEMCNSQRMKTECKAYCEIDASAIDNVATEQYNNQYNIVKENYSDNSENETKIFKFVLIILAIIFLYWIIIKS